MTKFAKLLALVLTIAFAACSSSTPMATVDLGTDAGADAGPSQVHLIGAASKGPFVGGVNVEVTSVGSSTLALTAELDSLGEFDVPVVGYTGLVDLTASGTYFDEISGEVSTGTIELRSRYEVTDAEMQDANVNALTHIISSRIETLMTGGMPYSAAASMAEAELRTLLDLGDGPATPASAMNFINPSVDSSYLFAASTLIINAARIRHGIFEVDGVFYTNAGPYDAELRAILDALRTDLSDDGDVAQALKEELAAAHHRVNVVKARNQLQAYLISLGSTTIVGDIRAHFDLDADGVHDDVDNCRFVSNADQAEAAAQVGVGEACKCGNGLIDAGEMCDVQGHSGPANDPYPGFCDAATCRLTFAPADAAACGYDACPTGTACVVIRAANSNFCAAPTTLGAPCTASAECGSGLTCVLNNCLVATCGDAGSDCLGPVTHLTCASGVCGA